MLAWQALDPTSTGVGLVHLACLFPGDGDGDMCRASFQQCPTSPSKQNLPFAIGIHGAVSLDVRDVGKEHVTGF